MAIRGTDSLLDKIVDATFVLNKAIEQYDQALIYFQNLQKRFSNVTRFYVCGHSLGGIVSKMIFPRTKVNTIAFNSPGVSEYLKDNNKPFIKSASSDARCMPILDPMAITFCANGCPIGNLRHNNDVGPYIWLPVKGEDRIPDKSDEIDLKSLETSLLMMLEGRLTGDGDMVNEGYNEMPDFDKAAIKARLTKYHSMADMYNAIKNSEKYKNTRF